ncbi:GGDEF domain-containing protein [Arenimonas sp. MALMAid1274]|uniref:GGDEF domain-containing protein n=1 Tax=Arenimonas sp. MALMAid1274 TaxID=3411630 RepID=UPI003B9F30CF
MTRPARILRYAAPLALAASMSSQAAVRTPAPPASDLDATVARCFELRTREPAAAVALAEAALATPDLPVDPEVKLLACLARAAALAGDAERTGEATARIDERLAQHAMPPEFRLRALSNAGAALHTVGRTPEALDFYARAFQAASQDESEAAQVTTLINVASIHSEELGAFEQAEAYFAQAAAIESGKGLADPALPYNRGINQLRLGRDADALQSFIAAETRALATGHEVVLQRARAELIALRAGEGELAAALDSLASVAGRQLARQDPAGAAISLIRMSGLALQAGDAPAALRHALAARAAVADTVFRMEQRDGLRAEIAARVALGQWRPAYEATQALRTLETDRLRSQQLSGLAGLQARLLDARSAEELARLQDERRLEALGLANARRLRNGAIAAFCALALLAGAFFLYQRRVNRKLHRLSNVDSLTGLSNRRAAETALAEVGAAVAEGDRRSVVFLIDVDRFKDFNDRLGHAAGDAILAATAARLRAACRPDDIVARWGGEEFLVGCRGIDRDRAVVIAERLRAAVGAGADETSGPVSVSIGFASLPFLPAATHRAGWQDSVTLADRALYAAKHGGRNTWVGLWGAAAGKATLADLLADPEAHARLGHLQVLAARQPVVWGTPPA